MTWVLCAVLMIPVFAIGFILGAAHGRATMHRRWWGEPMKRRRTKP